MEMPLTPYVIWEDLSHERGCCNYQLSSIIETTTTRSVVVNAKSSHKVKNIKILRIGKVIETLLIPYVIDDGPIPQKSSFFDSFFARKGTTDVHNQNKYAMISRL